MPTIPCNNYVVPIFEADECLGDRKPASCVIDSSVYSELSLSANSSQQQINQALYLSAIASKSITDGLQTQIDLTPSGEKVLTYTTSGDGLTQIFIFPHGLDYTPTMVLATGNTIDTISQTDGFATNSLTFFAFADTTNITISYQNYDYYGNAPNAGTDNLKWTVLCK